VELHSTGGPNLAGKGTFGTTLAEHTRTAIIAGSLADQVDNMKGQKITGIVFSSHLAAKRTAEIFRDVLSTRGCLVPNYKFEANRQVLDPNAPPTKNIEKAYIASLENDPFLVIVGHQPHLTRLAKGLLGRRLPAHTLPLGGSEVACIQLGDNRRLLWLLTDKSADMKADLRDKIKSKFDVAKFFIGALIINASVLLSSTVTSVWSPNMGGAVTTLMIVGSVMLILSLGLAVGTLLAFDRLTMPPEFWSEELRSPKGETSSESTRPPRWSILRPPSESTVVLFYEMIHTWTSLFQPALFTAIVSIMSFSLALATSKLASTLTRSWTAAVALGVSALGVGLVWYYSQMKPKLGFED
jgi:phosphohistidine phosphatase SixA